MEYLILFAILLPISTAILIVSMLLTSKFMGGVEFGTVGAVVAKGALLILLVDGITLIPYGLWLSLPLWWVGLMVLFGLDFWEARTLVFINWALNAVAKLLILTCLAPYLTLV